jgi:hypothetical protein
MLRVLSLGLLASIVLSSPSHARAHQNRSVERHAHRTVAHPVRHVRRHLRHQDDVRDAAKTVARAHSRAPVRVRTAARQRQPQAVDRASKPAKLPAARPRVIAQNPLQQIAEATRALFGPIIDLGIEPMPIPPRELVAPQEPPEAKRLRLARDYLCATATIGGTMGIQGCAVAIGRLHPAMAVRLADAVREARENGLSRAGPFSCYRPPGYGVGGYSDKFQSAHAYGLACDMEGIGGPGSSAARLWERIANHNGLYLPYGARNRSEWNHTQLVQTKGRQLVASRPELRRAIVARGPVSLERMWRAAGIDPTRLDRAVVLVDNAEVKERKGKHHRHRHV